MTILAAEFRVKNKGTFDLKGLYEYLHLWVIEEGYASLSDPEFPEVFHSQHEFGQGLKEHIIWWRLEKIPNKSAYYKYELDVNWRTVAIKDLEIIYQGKKLKLANGELQIYVYARIVTDYNGTWSKHWLLKYFNTLYWKVIMKSNLEKHKLELYREAYRLQETIKDYWKLMPGTEEQEHEGGFWPQEGIGE